MRLALSNAALPPARHADWLPRLAPLGIAGVVVSPRATWGDAWRGPSAAEVEAYGRRLRAAGLAMPALLASPNQHAGLGWLGDEQQSKLTLAWLAHLSAVCRDLGGERLVIGAGRWRHGLAPPRAWRRSLAFFQLLLTRIERHGVQLCLAPLSRAEGDFCLSATDCRILADALEHPAVGLALSARALLDSGEIGRHAVFASHYGRLEMFLADEPDGRSLGDSGQVDHAALSRHLRAAGYRDWVCLDQAAHLSAALPRALAQFTGLYRRGEAQVRGLVRGVVHA